MEAYPEDLLTGVFPLVFAVNTIISDKSEDADSQDAIESNQVKEDDEGDADNNTQKTNSTSSTRSTFERFLDTMASNLVYSDNESIEPKKTTMKRNRSDFVSLLRGSDNNFVGGGPDLDDSSDEEDLSMDSSSQRIRMGASLRNSRNFSPAQNSTAYANSLKVDGFFERARVVPISTKHGFPPSKDVSGQNNRSVKLSQARSALTMNPTNANAIRLKRVMDHYPIEGLLPSGWLEKHVHALPSALLVVTSFQIHDKDAQEKQDECLIQTIANLRDGLASKRECSIRVVCLADIPDQPTTPAKLDEWITRIRQDCDLSHFVTVLQVSHDLNSASPGLGITSGSVQKLHKEVRDASWAYYLSLARHNKRKLSMLGYDNQPTLLPLAVRYCFKIGLFYEFLLKHSKALKFFSDAYRHIQDYYRHLLGKQAPEWNPVVATTDIVNPQGDDGGIEAAISELTLDQHQRAISEVEGVEVALEDEEDEDNEEKRSNISASIPLDIRKIFTEINPPFDMANQCRAVADWINFKIVQAGLQSASFSESDQGILAASTQYRQHCQVFLKRDDPNDPSWSYWSYVAQQRHAISQLVERFPPRNLTSLTGLAKDEVLMRFSAWRNYAAAAEAKLRVGVELRKITAEGVPSESIQTESLRGRFVGGLDSEGFSPLLQEEAQENHTGIASEMLERAISRFEAELEKNVQEGTDAVASESFHRSGARIYYLAGGVLLGRKQHKEAIVNLEKALKYVKGWKGLELAIRRMLIECYEKYVPPQGSTTGEQSATIASMILDSHFNSKMSSRNLRRALDSFSSLASDGLMKWHRECIDESDSSLPFSFAITFPGTTHVTAGDTATASVLIKSNLDYAVNINSVTLLSMAGKVEVPPMSLLSAQNANEGNNGGIIVQGKSFILFTTPIEIPKDLSKIISDDSGNGGEKEGIAGKGSFAKSARPRTAGLTSAAGARLISENQFEKSLQDQDSQWSMRYLGGKTFRCDGIRLLFYPVHVEKAASSDRSTKMNIIELTIEKKRQRTSANIKRTPFEEDNYITSAWSRPDHLPLVRGPRCLRILGPTPQMIVTSITDPFIDGKAIEGTVNRILIKLQAGSTEICEDIKYRVNCASMLLCLDGTTKNLDEDLVENNSNASEVERLRSPCLVCLDRTSLDDVATKFGYSLPKGWKLVGSGRGTATVQVPPVSTLKTGEETYLYFDIYRPPRAAEEKSNIIGSESSSENSIAPEQLCQTDFDISITYKQARPKTQQSGGRGRRRRKPIMSADEQQKQDSDASNEVDLVSLEYTGSVLWTCPLSIEFREVDEAQKPPPAGSRHPSNSIHDEMKNKSEDTKEKEVSEIAIIDGERISTKCILFSNEIPINIDIGIARVWFEQSGDEKCEFRLVGENASSQVLFEADDKDLCRLLGKGKKTSIILNILAHMKDQYKGSSTSTRMGVICVDWTPKMLPIPSAAAGCLDVREHGPLPLPNHSTHKFVGPACFVESSPFGTTAVIEPPSPRVGAPFEVTFRIENKTNIYQTVSVALKDLDNKSREDILIAGSTKSELRISPSAVQILSYTGIATKPGKVLLPSIAISSTRYKTWLVCSSGLSSIYVLP